MMFESDVDDFFKEKVLKQQFDFDREWTIRKGKKIIFKTLAYREDLSFKAVNKLPRIKFNKNVSIYCGDDLVCTWFLSRMPLYYKKCDKSYLVFNHNDLIKIT